LSIQHTDSENLYAGLVHVMLCYVMGVYIDTIQHTDSESLYASLGHVMLCYGCLYRYLGCI